MSRTTIDKGVRIISLTVMLFHLAFRSWRTGQRPDADDLERGGGWLHQDGTLDGTPVTLKDYPLTRAVVSQVASVLDKLRMLPRNEVLAFWRAVSPGDPECEQYPGRESSWQSDDP